MIGKFLSFLKNMFTATCMAPGRGNKATNFPHGVPCCDKHYHYPECSSWLGYDCDCGKED